MRDQRRFIKKKSHWLVLSEGAAQIIRGHDTPHGPDNSQGPGASPRRVFALLPAASLPFTPLQLHNKPPRVDSSADKNRVSPDANQSLLIIAQSLDVLPPGHWFWN